jgi:hypothetical protein
MYTKLILSRLITILTTSLEITDTQIWKGEQQGGESAGALPIPGPARRCKDRRLPLEARRVNPTRALDLFFFKAFLVLCHDLVREDYDPIPFLWRLLALCS